MKINEKIRNVLSGNNEGSPTRPRKNNGSSEDENALPKSYYSFEYFPPKTQAGVENLLDRIERMGQTNPLWIDVTWNAGGVTSDITLELCAHIQ